MILGEKLCYWLSRRMILRRQRCAPGPEREAWYGDSTESYDQNRTTMAGQYLGRIARQQSLAGLKLLDFGCGYGELARMLLDAGAASVVGVDLNAKAIRAAGEKASDKLEFLVGQPESIPLGDNAVDAATCLDVWEHVMSPEPVLRELLRVVRPGGRILIEFYPWYSHCSAHLDGWIPIPWCHLLFSQRTLIRAAERIHNAGFFDAPWWLLDEDGNRKPFAMAGRESFGDDWLNRISERSYRRLLAKLGREGLLEVERYELIGFGGTRHKLSRIVRPLRHLPLLRELIGPPVFSVIVKR